MILSVGILFLASSALAQSVSIQQEVEEHIVLAPKIQGSIADLVELRRQSSSVAEVLASEQMARSGDSDAGSSLRRVTGLTLMNGKYIYVRGMGERYSAVTLNGSGLPSPEPARRVVPLDLFPTAILESVVVQKSFSAPLPGEFGGGLIQLRTKRLPQKRFFRAGVTQALTGNSKSLDAKGGSTDWMGVDDGTRAMPAPIRRALGSGRQLAENNPPFFNNGFSSEELVAMGRLLKNSYSVRAGEDQIQMPGLSLAGGAGHRVNGMQLGWASSLSYSRSGETTRKKSQRFNVGSGGRLARDEAAQAEVSENEVKAAASLDLGVEVASRHSLHLTGLMLRHSSEELAQKNIERENDSIRNLKRTTLDWVERQLLVAQLGAEHRSEKGEKPPWAADWRLQWAQAQRDQPDRREYTYQDRGQGLEFDLSPNGNQRNWSELKDQAVEGGFSLTHRHGLGSGELKLSAGAQMTQRERRSDTWRLHFRSRFPSGATPDLTRPIEEILAPDEIRSDGFVLTNLSESADSYTAEQSQSAQFAEMDWKISEHWVWQTGLRHENSRQEVKTFYYFNQGQPTSRAGLTTDDWLPSHLLTWRLNEQWRARLAYSETVTRPEFRELSTAPFIDEESGYETVGNSQLQGTIIRSLDHRWEYYPSTDESISVGAFFKQFKAPIEEVFEPSPNLRKTYANAESATNLGLEFEARSALRRFSRNLRRFTVMANFALIESQVSLGPEAAGLQTSGERPLQGQSPWIANFQLQYDRPAFGTSFTVLYNALGPRITEVGTAGRPDVFEQTVHQVDLVANKKVDAALSIGFRAKNIFDPKILATQGGEVVREQKRGSAYVVSLTANY
ncbi:MAG: TonB-dependent receptor [Bdellovibrionales bacterium]